MSYLLQWLKSQMNLFLHPFAIVPFFFFLYLFHKLLFNNTIKKNLPPSPKKLPIIGNLHQIDKNLPHRSLQALANHYGELMLLQFGQKPVVIVSSAKAAYEIMKTQDIIFADRPALSTFKKLLYNCKDVATAPYGNYWRMIRSVCVNQLLNYSRVQAFRQVREEETVYMIEEIKRAGKVVSLTKRFSTFATDVICRAAFGMKFSGERDGINFKDLHEKHEELIGRIHIGDFIPWLGWINYVNGVEREIKRVAKDMDRIIEGFVQEHMKRLGKTRGEKQEKMLDNSRDFVDVLLELQQDHTGDMSLSVESIKAIILDMFVAGSTTTFATLEWAMSELLINPRALETLKKEVRGITTGKTSITENDLEKMEYLKAVIKETFRMHPPVPLLLPRVSAQETQLLGYDIPAETQVIINAWVIHRNPAIWKDPEIFNPERFLNSPIDFRGQHFDLIPFGSGRRGCPGILFGTANIELVLASLIQKFDWALPEGKTLDMEEYPGVSMHRNMPLLAVATPT